MMECYTSQFWCSWWAIILVTGIFTFILWITTLVAQRIIKTREVRNELRNTNPSRTNTN